MNILTRVTATFSLLVCAQSDGVGWTLTPLTVSLTTIAILIVVELTTIISNHYGPTR